MKTLQLNKYLLVEPENTVYLTVSESGLFYADPESEKSELIEGKFKLICMGNEFEKDQKATKKDACVLGQIFCKLGFDAFVGEIEKEGFYWGENPIEKPAMGKYGWYSANSPEEESGWMYEEGEDKYFEALNAWKEAESKTFNPEKTLIFEIL